MNVQITGPQRTIEELLSSRAIPGAKARDLHRKIWIEAPRLTAQLEAAVCQAGCKVHHSEAK